jgi:uncharacterized ParB-like nuclease family protein
MKKNAAVVSGRVAIPMVSKPTHPALGGTEMPEENNRSTHAPQEITAPVAIAAGIDAATTRPLPEKNLGLGGINVRPDRLRVLRPDVVADIAKSMGEIGQLQPIIVQPREGSGNGYWLIAGRHRFEAAKKLKWQSIRCIIREGLSAEEAKLVEIDENLIRADLSPAERALHVRERNRAYEAKYGSPKARGGHAAQKAQGHKATANLADAFTTDTAKKTGISPAQSNATCSAPPNWAPMQSNRSGAPPSTREASLTS